MSETGNRKDLLVTCLRDYIESMEQKYQDMSEIITKLELENKHLRAELRDANGEGVD